MAARPRDDNILRLVDQAGVAHAFARAHVFEWVSAGMMVGMAVEIFLTHDLAIKSGSFLIISQLGIPDVAFVAFFATFGMVRCVALYLNGRLNPYGPFMRSAGALAGALVWSQLGVALTISLVSTHVMNLGIAIYLFMTIGEWVSCYRAMSDGRRAVR